MNTSQPGIRRRLARLTVLIAGSLLSGASAARAEVTPEQRCQAGRYKAAAKYAACQQKAAGRFAKKPDDLDAYREAAGRCVAKYAAEWPKLEAEAGGTGSTCDGARFESDSPFYPGTVIDNLTGLEWERKTDDATFLDKDNTYAWTGPGPFPSQPNGGAFIFAIQYSVGPQGLYTGRDCRVPTLAELMTIVLEPHPCLAKGDGLCIDPIFGPTAAFLYWSSTSHPFLNSGSAWAVDFAAGGLNNIDKDLQEHVRLVRGGL